MALDVIVPLPLGISIHHIHRWGEENVERVIFRREFRARSEISTFPRDAGFIAQPVTPFARTVEAFGAHGGGRHRPVHHRAPGGAPRPFR